MILSEMEKQSAMWVKLEGAFEERLQMLREKNDGALDQASTDRVRGAIGELKEILGWAKTTPKM